MVKLSRALSGMLVVVTLAACKDPLTVQNWNNPDRGRLFRLPSDFEVLIKGTYKTVHNGTFGADGIAPGARTMAWENASNLNNWGLGPRSAIPRTFIDNSRGNGFLSENATDFNALSRALRSAADGVNVMDSLNLGSAALNARARAFAWFSVGVAMGYLSGDYDSATIVDPHQSITVVPDLSSYTAVNAAALAALDSAIAWDSTAQTVTGGYAAGTMYDATWINGVTFTAAQFRQLIRTYKAYFRANVARTPAERAAVDWAKVRDDARDGITADLQITTGGSSGWNVVGNQWWLYAQWHQAHQMIIGMADSTGAYDIWLATQNANKVQFLVRTKDNRFPPGDTRAAQIANSPAAPAGTSPAGRPYFRNRASSDPDAAPWSSYYDWYRMIAWYNASRVGPFPVFVKAQNDLLRAEALIRLGDIPGAAALIDISRTASGLPALTGVVTTATQSVPGGAGCVPHVPQSPSYTVTACGNIMDALKWEYRMETMFVSYVSQWYSSRGWGDLPEGTAVHWPVPYQEMDARIHPFYSLAGVGRAGGSVGIGNFGY